MFGQKFHVWSKMLFLVKNLLFGLRNNLVTYRYQESSLYMIFGKVVLEKWKSGFQHKRGCLVLFHLRHSIQLQNAEDTMFAVSVCFCFLIFLLLQKLFPRRSVRHNVLKRVCISSTFSLLRPFVKSGLLIGREVQVEVKFGQKRRSKVQVEVKFRSK